MSWQPPLVLDEEVLEEELLELEELELLVELEELLLELELELLVEFEVLVVPPPEPPLPPESQHWGCPFMTLQTCVGRQSCRVCGLNCMVCPLHPASEPLQY